MTFCLDIYSFCRFRNSSSNQGFDFDFEAFLSGMVELQIKKNSLKNFENAKSGSATAYTQDQSAELRRSRKLLKVVEFKHLHFS